jgi:ABC-type dipeptide/oligopeptide/nickel transport system permease subunit
MIARGMARRSTGEGSGRARWIGPAGGMLLVVMLLACVLTLPYTTARVAAPGLPDSDTAVTRAGVPRFEATNLDATLLPPSWAAHRPDELERLSAAVAAAGREVSPILGTDRLGRDVLVRCLAGGGISLGIGLSAAAIAVVIGTLYGTIAAAAGGRIDALLMRLVDILYGLPSILLVVLIAIAVDGLIERRGDQLGPGARQFINIASLLVAIGSIGWLTMARVIRGQVLSLKAQPMMEACRAIGVGPWRQFRRHLLPNLAGPIIVYATLTVPAAILSESFLSFLGIGVREPLPSWGNLAADGLSELNTVRMRWWLLLWPCLFIALTLVSLNFLGEWMKERAEKRGA